MKSSHGWFVTGVHAISFAILLGLGVNIAFVIHTLTMPVFPDADWISMSIASVFGALLGFGAFGLYLKTEAAYQAILAYGEHYGERVWLRVASLILLNVAVIVIDIFGLLFRIQYLSAHGGTYLIVIGIALALFPFLAGLVLTPMVEPPAELVESNAFRNFQRTHVGEVYQTLIDAPVAERHRAFQGDIDGALDAAVARKEEEEEARRQRRGTSGGSLMSRAGQGVRAGYSTFRQEPQAIGLPGATNTVPLRPEDKFFLPDPDEDEEDEEGVAPFRKPSRNAK